MSEEKNISIHGQWSSRWSFILAATGSAVGLGNIWKFPYITGEYGGGAFVIVYLICVALIGIPIMMAEVMLGRRGRQSPINTMRALAKEEGRHGIWSWIGWIIAIFCTFFYLNGKMARGVDYPVMMYGMIGGLVMVFLFSSKSKNILERLAEVIAQRLQKTHAFVIDMLQRGITS